MSRKNRNSRQRRLARVRNAFDADVLKRICEMPQSHFVDYAEYFELPEQRTWQGETRDAFYFYQDNGADILFVAHLDNVQQDRTCTVVDTRDGLLALSGALDDRLGAYVGLELLPKLGIVCDILLTTNEEMGDSTAAAFYTDHKQYNWIIEFDRGGTDVVMYQFETPELRELVKAAGAKVGIGSFSDIAELEVLGCAAFNWGVGYYDYHSKRSHAWLEDTFEMVEKFLRFYAANATTFLEHTPKPRQSWRSVTWVDSDPCPICREDLNAYGLCNHCGYGWFEYDEALDAWEERQIVEAMLEAEGDGWPAGVRVHDLEGGVINGDDDGEGGMDEPAALEAG